MNRFARIIVGYHGCEHQTSFREVRNRSKIGELDTRRAIRKEWDFGRCRLVSHSDGDARRGIALRLPIANSQTGLTGSGSTGAVVERDGMKHVFIGGALIGQFEIADRDRGPRTVLLVTLANEPTMHSAPKAKYGNLRQDVDFD